MRSRLRGILSVVFGLLLLAWCTSTGMSQEPSEAPLSAEEVFSANTIIQARGGENVKWPVDPNFKTILEKSNNLKEYNLAFWGRDSLQPRKVKVYEKIPTQRNVVFLTFDDGPYTDEAPGQVASTETLLDICKAKGAHATFFLQGIWSFKNVKTCRRIVAEGNCIGDHTCHHPQDGSFMAPSKLTQPPMQKKLAELPKAWQEREVLWGRGAIVYALGSTRGVVPYFRAPHGSGTVYYSPQRPVSEQCLQAIANSGHVTINGTLILSDASGASADQLKRIYRSYFSKGTPEKLRGEILWLHSGLNSTVAALPEILDMLHGMGYSVEALPAGLEQVAALDEPVTENGANPVAQLVELVH